MGLGNTSQHCIGITSSRYFSKIYLGTTKYNLRMTNLSSLHIKSITAGKMRIPCSILIGCYILICTILSSNLVDAKCDHFWLDRYEDVLPTINNRPEFPDPLTREFQVKHYSIRICATTIPP